MYVALVVVVVVVWSFAETDVVVAVCSAVAGCLLQAGVCGPCPCSVVGAWGLPGPLLGCMAQVRRMLMLQVVEQGAVLQGSVPRHVEVLPDESSCEV